MKCYETNKHCKYMQCINCLDSFIIDFTQLKLGNKIKHGLHEFLFCKTCLPECKQLCIGGCHGSLTNLYFEVR